jgi:uncharacterized repeat protein (TIGR01451 family)
MSISGRLSFANRFHHSIAFAVGILLVASTASAGPSLWLYPKDGGPREGGHVVPPGEFVLVIENRGKDREADAAHEVQLVIAVEDPSLAPTVVLEYEGGAHMELETAGWEVGVPTLPCSQKPMPRHGVYPAAYATVDLVEITDPGDLSGFSDLAGGEKVEVMVTVNGEENLRVHFDAMARGYKKGDRCFDVANPSGHDVTVANRRGGQGSCGRVSITKTAEPSAIDLGEEVTFVIEVLNDGTCDLTELVVQDRIPSVEDDDGSYPAFQWLGETVPDPNVINDFLLEWPLDSLPVGEGVVVELLVEFSNPLADDQRVINRACVSAAELRKEHCAAAVVMVGNPYGDDGPAGPGFWCHVTRWILEDRSKLPVDGEELLAWLVEVDAGSDVFSGLYPIVIYDESEPDVVDPDASLMATTDLLCTPQSANGAADRLARHLLVLWLNVVSERLDQNLKLGELCMGDEILPEGADLEMTVLDLLEEVDAGLFAGAEDGQLTFWSEVVDAVNNSYVAGEGMCVESRMNLRRQAGNSRLRGKLANSRTND